ncbi:MAG: hypothetical protein LBE76_04025 [Nitrososphaerota archaeon]|nr:hypothetical protein [Nitrososphaerota archaeon]
MSINFTLNCGTDGLDIVDASVVLIIIMNRLVSIKADKRYNVTSLLVEFITKNV